MKYSAIIKISSLLCLSLFAATACSRFGLGDKVQSPTGLEEKPTTWENTTGLEPREEIESAYKKLFSSRSYRANLVETGSADGSDPETFKADFEFAAPYRFRTIQTGETERLSFPGEWIFIENDSYTKMPNSNWKKSSIKGEKLMDGRELPSNFYPNLQMMEESFSTNYNSSDDITLIGQDNLGGLPAKIYQFSSSLDVGTQKKSTKNKMWIGVKDGLPYRIETDTEHIMGPHTVKSKVVITFYDFGADIRIEPPI